MVSAARLSAFVLLLSAAAVPPGPTAAPRPVPGPGVAVAGDDSAYVAAPSALGHYLGGRLLEERGQDDEALAEYREALRLDPAAPGIELRLSEVTARRGDSGSSLEHAEQVLQREPRNARALWLKGGALFNLGRAPEALAALQGAVAADSGQAEYWKTLAHVAELLDRVDWVVRGWRHAVELDLTDGEAWFQLAAAEARLGHFAAADSMLGEATALNPARPGALFLAGWIQEGLGHEEEAVRLYAQHLEIHHGDQATRRRLVGLLARAGRLEEAYREAGILRRARPADPDAIGAEADLALGLGLVARGEELLRQLVRADPDEPSGLLRVADILARRGRGTEAGARVEAWAGTHPRDHRGPLLVARARAQVGDTTGALAAARRAVEMAPDSLAPRFVLGGLLQASRQYAAAESVWEDLVRRGPALARVGLDLAFCREQRGETEGAVRAAREVLAVYPDDATALNFLGYLFADHDRDLEEAEALVRRALSQDPDNGAYVDSMGWVYYRLGRLSEARRELERAVELTGGDALVREHLGDVYNGLGLRELAREQYRQSLSRVPDNPRVRAKLSESP